MTKNQKSTVYQAEQEISKILIQLEKDLDKKIENIETFTHLGTTRITAIRIIEELTHGRN